jgi:hypothetical protein
MPLQNAKRPATGATVNGLPNDLSFCGDTKNIAQKSGATQAQNSVAVAAAIADLTLDYAVEAAHVASVASRHFVEQAEIGDHWAAEHSLGVAVRHLREAAKTFREWQALRASAKEATR